jgi:hypothetical protein
MGLGKILGGFFKTHLVTLSGNQPPKVLADMLLTLKKQQHRFQLLLFIFSKFYVKVYL